MSAYFTDLANQILKYANENPKDFLFLVLIILTPFFLLSAFLSWKLAKHIEREKKKGNKQPKQNRETKKNHNKGSRVKRE